MQLCKVRQRLAGGCAPRPPRLGSTTSGNPLQKILGTPLLAYSYNNITTAVFIKIWGLWLRIYVRIT